jgi:hypothetical protein
MPAMAAFSQVHVCPSNLRNFDHNFTTEEHTRSPTGRLANAQAAAQAGGPCRDVGTKTDGPVEEWEYSAKNFRLVACQIFLLSTDRSSVIRTALGEGAGGTEDADLPNLCHPSWCAW